MNMLILIIFKNYNIIRRVNRKLKINDFMFNVFQKMKNNKHRVEYKLPQNNIKPKSNVLLRLKSYFATDKICSQNKYVYIKKMC